MLSGAMCRAAAIDGTAVFKMVVSSDSMKNATATSQGKRGFMKVPRSGTAPSRTGRAIELSTATRRPASFQLESRIGTVDHRDAAVILRLVRAFHAKSASFKSSPCNDVRRGGQRRRSR